MGWTLLGDPLPALGLRPCRWRPDPPWFPDWPSLSCPGLGHTPGRRDSLPLAWHTLLDPSLESTRVSSAKTTPACCPASLSLPRGGYVWARVARVGAWHHQSCPLPTPSHPAGGQWLSREWPSTRRAGSGRGGRTSWLCRSCCWCEHLSAATAPAACVMHRNWSQGAGPWVEVIQQVHSKTSSRHVRAPTLAQGRGVGSKRARDSLSQPRNCQPRATPSVSQGRALAAPPCGRPSAWTLLRVDAPLPGPSSVWTPLCLDLPPYGRSSAWTLLRVDAPLPGSSSVRTFLCLDPPLYGCSSAWTLLRTDVPLPGPSSVRMFLCLDPPPYGCSSAWTLLRMDVPLPGTSSVQTPFYLDPLLCGCSPAWTLLCGDIPLPGPSSVQSYGACLDTPLDNHLPGSFLATPPFPHPASPASIRSRK
ncbi:hypothetical protein H8959_014114 [Pygathrix nigripes]